MKSFVALLVIASIAYMAVGQTGSTTCTGLNNCNLCFTSANVPTSVFGVALICANCSTGNLLVNTTGACSAQCVTGCSWCTNTSVCLPTGCSSLYAYNSSTGLCVSCGTGASNCSISSGTLSVTCMTGYIVSGTTCVICGSTGTSGTVGAPFCATCSSTTYNISSTYAVYACTGCQAGYGLVALTATSSITTTIPWCALLTIASTAPNAFTAAQGQMSATNNTDSTHSIGLTTGFVGAGAALITFNTNVLYSFTSAAAGYFCLSTPTAAATTLCATAANAFSVTTTYGTAAVNCTAGIYPGVYGTPSGAVTCSACTTGYVVVGTTCVAAITGCSTYNSSTVCATAQSGYTVSSTGTVAACTVGSACTGGCGSIGLNRVDGTCGSGAQPSNCLYANSTSACIVCSAGYVNMPPVCQSCPTGCNTCTSATACATGGCATGYTLQSNNSCTKSSNSTSSNGKVLLSGVGFVSMILYYLF